MAETVGNLFRKFYEAKDLPDIVSSFTALCHRLGVDPDQYDGFYASLREKLHDWRCNPLWELLDARVSSPIYQNQAAPAAEGGDATPRGKRLLVIGAGPVGLRTAIEGALFGAHVDLVEKRSSYTRNNVVHLWPFLIEDLKGLGVKHFYSKFCSGSINHVCIKILQATLTKICLMLGVKVHFPVTFQDLIEPETESDEWRVLVTPTTSPVSSRHYDAVISADGKQYCLPGFQGKESRAKLAIGITMNFVNRKTTRDVHVKEIGGLAFFFDQAFFKELAETHGIDLENIVYFKDETHYFVMTAKKSSLLAKGVFLNDHESSHELLSSKNISHAALETYAKEAATFATKGGLGEMEFALNHRGENDVAMFDFTGFMSSENASRIVERKGKRLLLCIAGDSLYESFWPTGTGLARGFLGAFDAVWMFKRYCEGVAPLELIEEREALFNGLRTLLTKLRPNPLTYTIDPRTRYVKATMTTPLGSSIRHLYDTDVSS